MKQEIVTDYDELSEMCSEIDPAKEGPEMREIILNLKDTITAMNLNSLAAPQIGYDARIFCINYNGDIRTYINPVITVAGKLHLSRETCLSCGGKSYIRPRHEEITVVFTTPLGKIVQQKLLGVAATVFQRNLDLLNGILLSDIGFEVDEQFDNAPEEERQEVIEAYLKSLDMMEEGFNKEIESNETLLTEKKAAEFVQGVADGTIHVEPLSNFEDKKGE